MTLTFNFFFKPTFAIFLDLFSHLSCGVLHLGPLEVEPGQPGGRVGAVGLAVEGGDLACRVGPGLAGKYRDVQRRH